MSGFLARFFIYLAFMSFLLLLYPLLDMLTVGMVWAGVSTLSIAAAVLFLAYYGMKLWGAQVLQFKFRILKEIVTIDGPPQAICTVNGKLLAMNDALIKKILRIPQAQNLLLQMEYRHPDVSAEMLRLQRLALHDDTATGSVKLGDEYYRICVYSIGNIYLFWQFLSVAQNEKLPKKLAETLPALIDVSVQGKIRTRNSAAEKLFGQTTLSASNVFQAQVPVSGDEIPIRIGTDSAPKLVFVQEMMRDEQNTTFMLCPIDRGAMQQISGFNDFPVPLLKLAASGHILAANIEAIEILPAQNLVGGRMSDVMHGLGRSISRWVQDTARGQAAARSEFLRVTSDSKTRILQVTLRRAIEKGSPIVYAVLQDATELKALEERFSQSHKMEAIGQLAGGVAHDFNNLLTAISGHCDLLLYARDALDPDYSDIKQIQQNARRAASLVSQLLAFSRKQTLQFEALEVRDLISDMSHLLNRLTDENIIIEQEYARDLWKIRADKRQIEQVFINLIVNARDAMPNGGTINIDVQQKIIQKDHVQSGASVVPGRYIQIAIKDEGVGIPAAIMDRVFDPFFTTKKLNEGTGLGLSMVYGIIKQTEGYVFVDSIEGQGSTFTLLLPAADEFEEAAETTAQEQTKILQLFKGHVLLVEDEMPVRVFATRALALRGLKVTAAASGEEALEILEKGDKEFSLFITDVILPGLTGPEWVEKTRKKGTDVPVIFTSGYAENAFNEDSLSMKDAHFLPKPFSLSKLGEAVERALDRLS